LLPASLSRSRHAASTGAPANAKGNDLSAIRINDSYYSALRAKVGIPEYGELQGIDFRPKPAN